MLRQSEWDITVEDLRELRDAGSDFQLIDVREPREYEVSSLGGELIPLKTLPERVADLDKTRHIVVHCKSGGRSSKAVQLLRGAGFENVWNVNGFLLAGVDRIDPLLPIG